MYIAFDPGGRYTGWARFTANGDSFGNGTLEGRGALYQFLDMLHEWVEKSQQVEPLIFIIEDFELYPNMLEKQIYNKFEVVRTIGILEGWAHINNVKVIFQKPAVKPIGYKWAGLENKHKHNEDAIVHGIYWLVHNKIRSPVI